ncbi:MAG TPA: ferritin-like domain-containing protein [Propionibacteriaceae bacterium]
MRYWTSSPELAAVEHAVIAEYLQIAYVLGHRLPDPAPGPAGPAIADTAQKILSMAQFVEMKHLKLVNEFLVASGRPAQLGQAVGIDHSLGSGAMTVLVRCGRTTCSPWWSGRPH